MSMQHGSRELAEKSTRRDFIKIALAGLGGLALGGVIGSFISRPPTTVQTVTHTTTVTKTLAQPTKPKKFKAAWIYVGPIGDYGWSYEHDQGRKIVEKVLGPSGLGVISETAYRESVPEDRVSKVIEDFISQGYDIVYTTSFGYMDATNEAARKHPSKIFAHCSGYKRLAPNVATYFAEAYLAYYLNGIMAGALTKSNKIGYVAAHLIPEVIRHINAFTIGVREVNPKAEVYVVRIGAWYNPPKAREAAEALIAQGVDVLAFTEDSPTVLQVAESYQSKGIKIWSFSHYSDMKRFGKKAMLAGQIVDWGPLYIELTMRAIYALYALENGDEEAFRWIWAGFPESTPRDYWWGMREGVFDIAPPRMMHERATKECRLTYDTYKNGDLAEYMGCLRRVEEEVIKEYVNPILMQVKIPGKNISVLDYVLWRRRQILDGSWDPFTGPIYDNEGKLRIEKGYRASHDMLWNMDWFVEGVAAVQK